MFASLAQLCARNDLNKSAHNPALQKL